MIVSMLKYMKDYDKLADYYRKKRDDTSKFDYNRDIEVPAFTRFIGDVKDKVILDMGCGFGDHAKKLSKKSYKKLIGFDISERLVKFANEQSIPNSYFYVGDMSKRLKHKDSSFDVVFSSLAIHYVKNIKRLFREVNRVLKRGGIFCFSTGHPIFNLINQTDHKVVGFKKKAQGKREIYGDYFDESPKPNDLGGLGKLNICNFTFETLIKSGLGNGFELIDYKDAKPPKSAKKYFPEKYRLTTTLPTFILFKFKKK